MRKALFFAIAIAAAAAAAPDAQNPVKEAADAIGAVSISSIEYAGTGLHFALGQGASPGGAWPRFTLNSYSVAIDYSASAMRVELVRTQGEDPPRGGGGQPLAGEQRQIQFVSGTNTWNVAGQNATAAPGARAERMLQIWSTPHGFLKAALLNGASAKRSSTGTEVTFTLEDKFTVRGFLNRQQQVERVEAWIDNPVLGDMLVETTYSGYRSFGALTFPSRIVQRQGGFPVLDLTVTSAVADTPIQIDVPQNVIGAAPPKVVVDVQRATDGVYYLTGGSHHSVAIEMKDHIVLIEAPQNEERSLAVTAKVRDIIPGKAIKYVVNTHHHFDHSGGLRTYVADGAAIVTHQANRAFYEQAWAAPRTLAPDRLAASPRKPAFVTFNDRHVMSDGTRTIELHHIVGNTHNDAIVLAYLPRERLLVEADVFTPPPPDARPPAVPNPFSVNLYENLRRLNLDVAHILPIHGRMVALADLTRAIGRGSD